MEYSISQDRKKLFIILFLIIVFIIVVAGLLTTYYVGGIYKDWLSKKDANMEMMSEYYNNEVVNIDDINILLENMLLTMQDKEFYNHKGVKLRTVTITHQLARKFLITKSETQSRLRVFEMFMAHEIEHVYTKREILAMYFNAMYLGDGNYGFEAASNYYFGKLLKDCRLVEYAILVAMLPNPTYYSIIDNTENNRGKVVQILNRMASHGLIDEETLNYGLEFFDKNYSNLQNKVIASQLGMTVL